MKKYGVYVKFSNAEEFAQLGGYSDNEDNVVARFVSFSLLSTPLERPTTHLPFPSLLPGLPPRMR